VTRVEDPRFLTGRARFVDDLVRPGMLHLAFARSTVGHADLTGVDVSPDLRQATVYYSVLGPAEQHEATSKALHHAGSHLRTVLGHQVRLKYLPRLSFREDPAITTGQRVEDIIRELHRQEGQ